MSRYETVSELLAAVRKLGIQVSREETERGVEELGLREPFGSGDLEDLVSHLGPKYTKNSRIIRLERVLASKEWSDAVVAVRLELGIPSTGLPEGEALAIHKALLETELGQQPMEVRFNAQEWRPVAHFWKELISGSRRLCALLGIDPRPLDNLRESYAGGAGSTLIGVRKLLSPEGAFRFGGKELPFGPTQIDYLIGHVLWRLPLDPATMEPKPSVSYEWKRLDDDNGRFLPHVFNQKDATASERREMKMKLEGAKRSFRDVLLLTVAEGKQWRGLTWEERWRKWNGLFPDFACQTPEALQKACQYAVNNRKKIQTRFEKLTQIPSGS